MSHFLEIAALQSTTDPVSQSIVAVIIAGVFALLAQEKVHRLLVVIGAVALLWAFSYLTPFHLISFEGAKEALDMNVLFLLAGMMALVGVLKTTGVFEWTVARMLNNASGDPVRILVMLIWFTGLLSALADNVTTVIFVAPMAIQIARTMRASPAMLLLPVVLASNIGGAATLVGDPPNIMIGSGAGLTFLDFLVNLAPPVMLMLALLPWLCIRYYRSEMISARQHNAFTVMEVPAIKDPVLLRWALWICGLVFVGFLSHGITGMPTSVPATIGAGTLLIVQDILYLRTHKPTHQERQHGLLNIIEKEIEWPTLSFFGFLFIAVGAAVSTGLIDTLAVGLGTFIQSGSSWLALNDAGTLLFAALLIVWVSAIMSSIIDNIPFVAVMIPIVHRITPQFSGDTSVLWWALALGACLGGNGSLIGASANVTVVGIAERFGIHITFRQFAAVGAKIAAWTLVVSSAFLATHVFVGARGSLYLWLVLLVIAIFVGRSLNRSTIAPEPAA